MRRTMDREFYIPKAEGMKTVTRDGIDATVYVYEVKGRPHACMFGGKRSKPDSRYYYRSVEARDKAVEDYFDGLQASIDFKAAYKAKQKDEKEKAVETIKVGGYDQTNVEFFQILEKKGKKVTMVELAQVYDEKSGEFSAADYVKPNPFKRIGKPFTKMVTGKGFNMNSYSYAMKWNGKALYQTASGYGH